MASGGPRTPSSPAVASGPGAQSQRIDGGPASKQTARWVAGGDYGDGGLMGLQQGATMAASGTPGSTPASAGQQGMPAPQGPPVTQLTEPTQRPDEPVTSGADAGPGPGREALRLPPSASIGGATAKSIVQNLAQHPDAAPALKTLASILGGQQMSGTTPLPQSPQDVNVANANAITAAVGNGVRRSPDITAAILQAQVTDPNVAQAAVGTADLTSKAQAVVTNQQNYNTGGILQHALNDVTSVASKVAKTVGSVPVLSNLLQWANKPLQEIQKDFKFINAVYDKHGVGPGLLATLGVLASGAAGTVFSGGNPLAGAAAADLAMVGERNLFGRLIPEYHDALALSNDPNYKVSAGRELAMGLSNIPGLGTLKDTQHGLGQFVSGTTDAIGDLTFDPVIIGGKASALIKGGELIPSKYLPATVEYAKAADNSWLYQLGTDGVTKFAIPTATEPLAQSATGISNWLMMHSNVAYTPQSLKDMVAVSQAKSATLGTAARLAGGVSTNPVIRAFKDIAENRNSAAEVAQQYPDLARQTTPRVMDLLGKTKTVDEVTDVLAQSLHSAEIADDGRLSTITNLNLPTRTFGRALGGKISDKIRQSAGDTTVNEERNLLFSKKVAVMQNKPVLDANDNPLLDANGNQVVQRLAVKNPDGTNKTQILQGGLVTGNVANALAGKLRTFTGYKALSVGKSNLEQSGSKMDLTSPTALKAVYDMAMYALPHNVALEKAAKIVMNPDRMAQAQDYASLVKEIVKTAGIRDSSEMMDHVMSQVSRFTMEGSPVTALYGGTHDGENLGEFHVKPSVKIPGDESTWNNGKDLMPGVPDALPSGVQSSALWTHQQGGHGIIDFKQLRSEMQKANLYNRMYTSTDDFFTYYTEKIFAPLTLFTSGFGIRVAGNEALHQIIRHGAGDYMQHMLIARGLKYSSKAEEFKAASKVAEGATQADLDAMGSKKLVRTNEAVKLIKDKMNTAQLVARNPIGSLGYKITPYIADDKLAFIAKMQQKYGFSLPAIGSSAHTSRSLNAATEAVDQGIKTITHGTKAGEDFHDWISRNDPKAKPYWALGLSKLRHEAMARSIAKDYLDHSTGGLLETPGWENLTEDQKWTQIADRHVANIKDVTKFQDERVLLQAMRNVDPDEFGRAQVADFRRQVTGHDGTVHKQLMRNVQDGKPTYSKDLADIPQSAQPLVVLGKKTAPTIDNAMERVIESGYRTVVNPIVDYISREPIFNHYAYENYRALQPMVKSGLITDDEAIAQSAVKGAGQMVGLIHNPPLRSQFAMVHRNLMPFYFAQEQALKRVGRLIQSNPQAFRDFQMINQGMNNPGFVHVDSNGTKYIVYPILGEFGNAAARGLNAIGMKQFSGLPSSVTGSTASLLSVLPEMKLSSIGPFANLALTDITKKFPALAPIDNALTGGYPATDWINSLLPNSSVRDMWNALSMDQRETAVHNSFLSAVAAAYYHGDIPDGANGTLSYSQMTPAEQQAIMDKIENNARTNLFVKGILAFFLPLSPGVSNDTYNKDLHTLRSEFVTMTLPKAQGGQGLDLKTATADFMNKYGDRSLVYTVSKTTSGSGGASLPLAQSTLDWIAANKGIMSTNAAGAAYLVPQTTGSPDALKVEQKLLTMHLRETLAPQDFISATFVAKGWSDLGPSLRDYEAVLNQASATHNKIMSNNATTVWQNVIKTYGESNPIWYADYLNPTRTDYANRALSDLQTLSAKGQLGNTPQASGIQKLLASYADYHAILQQSTIDHGLRHTAAYSNAKNAWFDYVTKLSVTNPELTNVINGVFKKVT